MNVSNSINNVTPFDGITNCLEFDVLYRPHALDSGLRLRVRPTLRKKMYYVTSAAAVAAAARRSRSRRRQA